MLHFEVERFFVNFSFIFFIQINMSTLFDAVRRPGRLLPTKPGIYSVRNAFFLFFSAQFGYEEKKQNKFCLFTICMLKIKSKWEDDERKQKTKILPSWVDKLFWWFEFSGIAFIEQNKKKIAKKECSKTQSNIDELYFGSTNVFAFKSSNAREKKIGATDDWANTEKEVRTAFNERLE